MKIGEIGKDDEKVRFTLDLRCTNCQRRVPGGMVASRQYFGTDAFLGDVARLKETYLCGVCRDALRTGT